MGDLKEELKEIKEILSQSKEKEKEKKFRFPVGEKVGKSKAKKGYVTVIKINENGYLDFKKEQIKEQTIMVDGIPRLATPQYVLHWKKNPVVILPSWSVEPFSPEQDNRMSLVNGTNIKGFSVLMSKMKTETVNAKKTMGGTWKWLIGLGIAAVIGYAIITGGAK